MSATNGIRLRAVLLGIALIPVNCYWVIITEVRWYSLDGSCLPLFVTPVFILFLLVLLNLGLRRFSPRLALRSRELITIYIMVALSSTLAGHDTLQNLFGTIAYPLWYVNENPISRWPRTFFAYLPRWLLVWDLPALKAFHEGNSSWLRPEYLRPWAIPLAAWTGFVGCMLAVLFCVNALLRRPWSEHEKLAFPIVQLPLAMCQETGFLRNRLMWIGFAFAFSLRLFAGLNRFFPGLPYLKIKHGELFLQPRTSPWNAIGWLPFSFYPFMIGLTYFIPLDLSFSCWFFYLFRHLQVIVAAAAGWGEYRDVPYVNEQSSGAWVGMGLVLLWSLRRHLRQAFRALLTKEQGDREEPLGYRGALVGLLLGLLGMGAYCVLAGMSILIAMTFLCLWLLVALTIARVRAEFGSPHEIYFINPTRNLVAIFGTEMLGTRNLTGLSMMYWFNRCVRNHPMPNQLEAMRMAESTGWLKQLAGVVVIASIVSIVATYCGQLYQGYRDGASAKSLGFKWWLGWESFAPLSNWVEFGEPVRNPRRIAMLAGLGMVFLLRAVRDRYPTWPLHPAGYALGMSFALDYFWFAFLLGWLAKLVIVRYGGMRAQRKAIPFFLGLILGDYVMGSLWAIYGPAKGVLTYKIFI